MRIVVVIEKPAMGRALAPHVRERFPNDSIHMVCTMTLGAYRYAVSRHLAWHDFPLIHTPDTLVSRLGHRWLSVEIDAQGGLHPIDQDATTLLRTADRIVNACDPWHGGCFGFAISVQGALGLSPDDDSLWPTIETWWLQAMDAASIRNSLEEPRTFNTAHLSYARTKRYVDHQFRINAWAILGRCLEQVGAPTMPMMSKYMVQTLYLLQHRLEADMVTSEGVLFQTMKNWKGSGHYPSSLPFDEGIGSAMSRATILGNLVELGLLSYDDRDVHLTERGEHFLSLLHPDCEDPDLIFRLHAWCEAGLSQSKGAIDRYIRTWFGKQKRRMDGSPRSAPSP